MKPHIGMRYFVLYCSRENSMGLIVALDDSFSASGSLFWDDGETVDTQVNGLYALLNFTASDVSFKHMFLQTVFHSNIVGYLNSI